jgi:acyl-CoA synthetase (AMP-forming)/AMP-acid ligase II
MIFKSPRPGVTIPTDQSFTAYVFQQAHRWPDKVAMIDGPSGRSLTYGQLIGAIQKVATGLAQKGFGKGDVFGIYSPNIPEYAIAFHAVASLGGINTTINPLYTADELAKQLTDSKARFLLTVPPFLDKAQEAAQKANIEEIFVFGEAAGATPFASLLTATGPAPAVSINPQEDLVVLPYSSGTTGLPKGVMLTHYNLIANLAQIKDIEHFDEKDKLIAILPFFHIYGMVVIMSLGLYKGATLVSMPRFEMEQFLQILQDHQISRAYLVPPIVLGLAKHPLVDKYDLSALKTILSGAAPLSAEVSQACHDRLGCVIKQGYGMTEMSPVTHLDSDEPAKIKLGAIGHLIPNTEARIIDIASGAELANNQEGELLMRGPQLMRGYLNNPGATAASIDEAGWYHSGDVAYVDDDGYFYIVDRVKELIKYKGLQVAPAELEAILLTNPAIADAAVIPSPDEEAGEIPKAFVVLRGEISPDEIMAFVAAKVAPHKRVRKVEIVDQIPKSASGKILRRLLVDRERGKT